VVNQFITGGDTEPSHITAALDAMRNDPNGGQALREGMLSDAVRRKVIVDGQVDPAKFKSWYTQDKENALKQFPSSYQMPNTTGKASTLADEFQSAAALQNHVDVANAGAAAAIKANGNSIAKQMIGEDPQLAVEKAMNKDDGGKSLSQIRDAVKDSPAALSALQGHVTRGFLNKFASESRAPAGQDNGMIYAQKSREFIQAFRTPLRQILGGQGMNRLDQLRAQLQENQGAEAAIPGSQTTPLRIIASGAGVGAHKPNGMAGVIGGDIGEHLMAGMGHSGLIKMAGAAGIGVATHLGLKFRAAGIDTQNDLRSAMMQHPDLLKAMIQKYPVGPRTSAVMVKNLGTALNAVTMSTLSGQTSQKGN
jgi:hypothetical protein